MKLRVTPREFALLRDYIQDLCGILLQDEKAYLIENRLSGLAEKLGCRTFGELYLKVKNSPRGQDLQNQVVVAITTNETLWFRDGRPFRIMAERILPMLYGRIESGERAGINIWSAACSTGQEPYSIAMTVLDYLASAGSPPADLERVSILATDISP
ncbi:MAG: hypothetical protein GY859_21030, partial [Desulfobacterales bacterium]|nr:hypothetical protein [Desulfobacterales bacterium]